MQLSPNPNKSCRLPWLFCHHQNTPFSSYTPASFFSFDFISCCSIQIFDEHFFWSGIQDRKRSRKATKSWSAWCERNWVCKNWFVFPMKCRELHTSREPSASSDEDSISILPWLPFASRVLFIIVNLFSEAFSSERVIWFSRYVCFATGGNLSYVKATAKRKAQKKKNQPNMIALL